MKCKDNGYTLELTYAEAVLLKGMIQNPMFADEDVKSYEPRAAIWAALDDQGVKIR